MRRSEVPIRVDLDCESILVEEGVEEGVEERKAKAKRSEVGRRKRTSVRWTSSCCRRAVASTVDLSRARRSNRLGKRRRNPKSNEDVISTADLWALEERRETMVSLVVLQVKRMKDRRHTISTSALMFMVPAFISCFCQSVKIRTPPARAPSPKRCSLSIASNGATLSLDAASSGRT